MSTQPSRQIAKRPNSGAWVAALAIVLLPCFAAAGDPHEGAHEHGSYPHLARFADVHMERAFPFDCGDIPGKLTYTLLEPARVRIRVVAAGTRELFLRHIVDWDFRDKGTHTETWDCRDNSGHRLAPGDALIRLIGEPMSSYSPGSMPLEQLSVEETIHGHRFGHTHNKHHEFACGESQLRIVSPQEGANVSGKVLVESEVDKRHRGYGDTYGYGVRYYIDSELVNEQFYSAESGGLFSYELDTTAFVDGEHMLRVGMCDHNDHATSASVRIHIDYSALRSGRGR